MYPIATTLKVGNNQLDSYLPIRNKNNDINWQFVTGLVLSSDESPNDFGKNH
ncbi:hypothetical protein [Escherichia coli]|uniref:hypothetical protein n=1 Tax=Escherichia coli TaxID=562 RepID=UPI0012FF6D1C|nr:hypothetical protein [Escherichia coli]MBC0494131.1 hypothetical protein [Escherichia coli]MBM2973464.1 hypothetical protein [Escherichia coli]